MTDDATPMIVMPCRPNRGKRTFGAAHNGRAGRVRCRR